ncbi:MAG: winged helix-turn-helix transcriptional regulator [Planctomycetes bacterium]|nr:winged helix-turn-helix transcriptional regulator [Planctomycetota bacterium]
MRAATTTVDPVLRLKAMADEQRLRILNVLQDGEICVGDLVVLLDAPQPTVSRNLAILKRAGLVSVRRSGLWAFYDLHRDRDSIQTALYSALEPCGALPQYAGDREMGIRLRTTEGCCPEGDASKDCGKAT